MAETERALQAELAVVRQRADNAEAIFEMEEGNREVDPPLAYHALDRNLGPAALESFIERNVQRAASTRNEPTRFGSPAPEMSMRRNSSPLGYSRHLSEYVSVSCDMVGNVGLRQSHSEWG